MQWYELASKYGIWVLVIYAIAMEYYVRRNHIHLPLSATTVLYLYCFRFAGVTFVNLLFGPKYSELWDGRHVGILVALFIGALALWCDVSWRIKIKALVDALIIAAIMVASLMKWVPFKYIYIFFILWMLEFTFLYSHYVKVSMKSKIIKEVQ